MYGDGDNNVIRREFPSLEQRHFNQTTISLVDLKVKVLRSGCNELAETGVVLQPLRGHHFVVQHRVWGRAAARLWRDEGGSGIKECLMWLKLKSEFLHWQLE